MKLTVQNFNQSKVDEIDVSIFDTDVKYELIQRTLIWHNAKIRQPIAHTKNVSDIRGSTRKIYKM